MNTAYGKLVSSEFKVKRKIKRRKDTRRHDLNEQEAPMKASSYLAPHDTVFEDESQVFLQNIRFLDRCTQSAFSSTSRNLLEKECIYQEISQNNYLLEHLPQSLQFNQQLSTNSTKTIKKTNQNHDIYEYNFL